MFSLLLLFSLLALILIQVSVLRQWSERNRESGECVWTCIDWRSAMSFQPATSNADCSYAAVYQAGVPPGLHKVTLADLFGFFENSAIRLRV